MGQILHPADWEHKFSKDEVAVGDQVDLIFEITIDPKWYLYSSDFDPELGPKVTEFQFLPDDSYQLVDGIRPIGAKESYDEIFEGNYTYFKERGEFRQTVKILKVNPVISGSYDYQVCSDIDGKCIPFDEDFTFKTLKVIAANLPQAKDHEIPGNEDEKAPAKIGQTETPDTKVSITDKASLDKSTIKVQKSSVWSQKTSNTPYSLLTFVLGAFLAGMLALLTPCVYPMIPMTVTVPAGEMEFSMLFSMVFVSW